MLVSGDQVVMGVSHLPRKSARMLKAGARVVLDNRERKIASRAVEPDGTVVLTDEEGNVFRRPGGAKIEVI